MKEQEQKPPLRIAFTGHRDKTANLQTLITIATKHPTAIWIHGGADGFDSQVETIAQQFSIKTEIIRPDYKRYSGKAAPLIRNRQIVDSCNVLVACYDGRESGGTFQTIFYARAKGVQTHVIKAYSLGFLVPVQPRHRNN